MDYINYVKQSPLSMLGMGGMVGGLAFAGASYDTTEINAGDRGIMAGGAQPNQNYSTKILSFDITTTGNATRFGDMYVAQSTADAATSDSHGGLS